VSKQQWIDYKNKIFEKITDYSIIYPKLNKQREERDGWIVGCCPLHSDKNPSFTYNRNTGVFCCFSKCGKGDALDFLMNTSGMPFTDTLIQLGDKLGIPRPSPKTNRPPIKESLITQFVKYLDATEDVKRWLREKRGLLDAAIKKYEIGWFPERKRNTIPIRDERGNLVNIRLYNAKNERKMINYTDGKYKYGSPARLYGLNDLVKYKGNQVCLTEGEWDRLLLQQDGFMAVTGTHGCKTFRPEWVSFFKGKDIVILYDCDREGQDAAKNIVLNAFKGSEISSIKNIVLPLKGSKDDKDVTDYLHKRGFTPADLQELIDNTPVHTYQKKKEEIEEEIIPLDSFTQIEQKKYVDKKVQCQITICGDTSEAFHAVEEFIVTWCPRQQSGNCHLCGDPIQLPRGSREYIGSCMSTDNQVIHMLRTFCCEFGQKPTIKILKRTTIKEFFCHQKINRMVQMKGQSGETVQKINGKPQEIIEKKVYYISADHPNFGSYEAIGWVKSHPKTQQVTLLIETLIPLEDDYEKFDPQENENHFNEFKKIGAQSSIEILTDHVTKIYQRDELLLAILLTYCSPRYINFNNSRIRGWIVTSILGDAGSGKTQTYQNFSNYVDIGDTVSGLTASRTGIAYALVEHKQRGWQIKIGRYPANTGKLLIIDEVQFIEEYDLRVLAKAMEEGFFQVDRVISRQYQSETRLILIGNPKPSGYGSRGRATMDDLTSFGCEALKTIFDPPIIRRIDMAVFTHHRDIKDLSFINKRSHYSLHDCKITPKMLRSLIYWAWNLHESQISFHEDATKLCLKEAENLAEMYGYAASIPLVTREDMRNKLARISTARAVLGGSWSDNFKRLTVYPEHVEKVVRFLKAVYDLPNCQLRAYSDIEKENTTLTEKSYKEIKEVLSNKIQNEITHSQESESALLQVLYIIYTSSGMIRSTELADQSGYARTTISETIKLLNKFKLIFSNTRGAYKKKPKFNELIRRITNDNKNFFNDGIMPQK
jgi:hypothetical protein